MSCRDASSSVDGASRSYCDAQRQNDGYWNYDMRRRQIGEVRYRSAKPGIDVYRVLAPGALRPTSTFPFRPSHRSYPVSSSQSTAYRPSRPIPLSLLAPLSRPQFPSFESAAPGGLAASPDGRRRSCAHLARHWIAGLCFACLIASWRWVRLMSSQKDLEDWKQAWVCPSALHVWA